jgi:hypothetical protein
VLHLLGREVRQRIERLAIVDLEVASQRNHLRRDELLHVAEQMRVGTHLDVVELRFFLRSKRRDRVGGRELRRKPSPRRVESPAVDDFADPPVDPIGVLQAVPV